ncbi:hypothetical protein [Citreimonas salinaria]|uniref:DUF2059 domain-containing protein n=1 Tax=Citreimonas salinaria TaxID=321339 RepID=A0A1H3IPF4_9RHOB|nr:hypothetical protein [Citreimonas salinaria]SDY29487.1 hypothetical protein SAMN05444340_105190 [Citreimonas salinaria]
MLVRFTVLALALSAALPARAQDARDLYDLLRLDDLLGVMRLEGLAYGQELGSDLFGAPPGPSWAGLLDEIYDTDRMESLVEARFTAAIDPDAIAPLVRYFDGEDGREIVSLEIAAREAMIDDAVEEAARERYRELAAEDDSPRLERVERFVEAGDLVEANVAGALNASLRFYSGLADGGAIDMSEDEILREVWSTEEETRADTREWVYGFLLLAYRPLEPEVLEAYVDLAEADAGRALNAALFEAFNAMYDDISYALGLAAAREMTVQEL